MEDPRELGFRSMDWKNGFQMYFKNGLVLSVQFDKNHYCARHDDGEGAYNAECAVWKAGTDGREWMTRKFFGTKYDDVESGVSPERLARIIPAIAFWEEPY